MSGYKPFLVPRFGALSVEIAASSLPQGHRCSRAAAAVVPAGPAPAGQHPCPRPRPHTTYRGLDPEGGSFSPVVQSLQSLPFLDQTTKTSGSESANEKLAACFTTART